MVRKLEDSVNEGQKKILGPLDYVPLAHINVSKSELVISELNGPHFEEVKREWTLSDVIDWICDRPVITRTKRSYYGPPIFRQRISGVRNFEITQDEEGRYYIEYS